MKQCSITAQVRSKERHLRNIMRTNYRIIRSILCQDDVDFKQVGELHSSTLVVYQSNRLYTDSYRKCYTSCGYNGKPTLLYKLPNCSADTKIEDALICEFHPEEVSEESRPHLITLSKDNWIRRCDVNTGRVLQAVYLHSRLRYNYLNWNEEGFSFVVKTTKSKTTCLMRAADVECHILLTMAVFTIYPLELAACMEIDKRIFGVDTTGAHLDGCNILFTSHQRGIVRFYSFQTILKEHPCKLRLGDNLPNSDGCKIGDFPHGIPITLRLKERPAVLFEVRCFDHDVKFGGFPMHYMMSPPASNRKGPSVVKVYSLLTKEEASNGTLERNQLAVDNGLPSPFFHFDGSERIINTNMHSISILKLKDHRDGGIELVEDHVINPRPHRNQEKLDNNRKESLSRRGRLIKHTNFSNDEDLMFDVFSCQMINNIGCEADLDITAVSMANHDEEDLVNYVSLHDNPTGCLLKTFRLPGEWDETIEHHICLDLDTLIHSYKKPSGKWVCEVFRAQRKLLHQSATKKNIKYSRRSKKR